MSASILASSLAEQQAIVYAYRHLYRQGLKAIRYSTPARHALRSTLRNAFRSSSREDFDPSRIANTLRFLESATEFAGLEHRIVRNLLIVRFWEMPQVAKESRMLKVLGLGKAEYRLRQNAFQHYNSTLERLNESLGMCLK
ncbi:uncharacterized protein N7459_003691 [Penicillium hispanicum]|uniref:uncharacterized protein n=1 Tax=Penicillium hispanicum TaxID=1080232 RepID=UPI00253F9081|nr:uncharacterized protein N7459_003691 [Penicillium hispanicum]KAJ5587926.1 hypothetical protein N7459_003691 [Penicillium hispanicum]